MKEDKLIFLISQPRSGSSLMQQLIVNSNKIVSSPESWQMLNLVYTYKNSSLSSGYNPNFSIINFRNDLYSTENGLSKFKNEIKNLALSLYSRKVNNKEDFFLDKTPRYYHIIDELYELFPEAKFLFLVRNPLNVFASIMSYNFKGDYINFLTSKDRIDDLFLAPKKINEALENYTNNVLIKYEDLVQNPKEEIKKIFNYLEIEIPKNCENYNLAGDFVNSSSIDKKSLQKHNKPTEIYLDSWVKSIDSSQKKVLALDFLRKLKESKTDYFGYDLQDIIVKVKNHKPKSKNMFNLGFGYFVINEDKLTLLQIVKKRIFLKLQNIW